MRYLILSDIHSNLVAFETVLEQAQGKYDQVLCLGDVVGYGPDPNQVIDRLRQLRPAAIVRGNHDKACCGISDASDFNVVARAAAHWTREQLSAENLSFLRQLVSGPVRITNFQIVHGSVLDEDEYVFLPQDALESLKQAEVPLTFCGHTHFQGGFLLRSDDRIEVLRVRLADRVASTEFRLERGVKYLLNLGSIGQPRDGDARAGFGFYDDERRVVDFWRVPYDVAATQQKMLAAELPPPLIARLALGR